MSVLPAPNILQHPDATDSGLDPLLFLNYFGLADHPFLNTRNTEFHYQSRTHRQAKSHLEYALQLPDGVSVITGDIGTGKKMLIHECLSALDNEFCVAELLLAPKDDLALLTSIITKLGVQYYKPSKDKMLNAISECILTQQKKGCKFILVLHEAQNYNIDVFEQIRNLSDIKINNQRAINVILAGTTDVYKKLEASELSQLTRRIRYRIHVNTLNESETYEYILHRLYIAGCDDPTLFESEAIRKIFSSSSGHPQQINELCSIAMMRAFVEQKKIIDEELIKNALKELQRIPQQQKSIDKIRNYSKSICSKKDSRPKIQVYLKGKLLGEYSVLNDVMTIGRNTDNDIYINDPRISRYHASITTKDGVTMVQDLGSTNGIFVNKINTRLAVVEDNDIIQIGLHQLKFVKKVHFVNKEDEFEEVRKSISDTIDSYLKNVDKILSNT